MQANGTADEETCAYNDLALVKLDPSDVGKVNPSIPDFGGPTGVGTAAAGEQVYTYGNSSLRGGVTALSPKNGVVVERSPGGWSYSLYTLTPGIPGDSGSAFLNKDGAALGVLSTVAIAPLPGLQRRRRRRERDRVRASERLRRAPARQRHGAVPEEVAGEGATALIIKA